MKICQQARRNLFWIPMEMLLMSIRIIQTTNTQTHLRNDFSIKQNCFQKTKRIWKYGSKQDEPMSGGFYKMASLLPTGGSARSPSVLSLAHKTIHLPFCVTDHLFCTANKTLNFYLEQLATEEKMHGFVIAHKKSINTLRWEPVS